jgi:alkaline phosphatase
MRCAIAAGLIGALLAGCQRSTRADSHLRADSGPPAPQSAISTPPPSGGPPKGVVDAAPPSSDAAPTRAVDARTVDARPDTPAPDPAPSRIVAAGDIACSGCAQVATADAIEGLLADRHVVGALVLGDEAYASGLLSEFQAFYEPAWGRPEILGISHPVPGNHEYATGTAAGYFDYFDGPGAQSGAAGPRDQGYYSFDLAGWHLIALNSSDECRWVPCAAGSPQHQWLLADLAAHATACTLAFWHHPRFQAGATSGELDDAAPLWDALYDAGVDVVLNGHEHGYQQLAPLDKAGQVDPARGIRTFVVGTGGGEYDTTFSGPRVAALETTLTSTHGVLELTLHPDRYEWQFVATDGSRPTAASGAAVCH